jgi:hypothetical protein
VTAAEALAEACRVYAEQAADKLRSPNCQLRNNWSGGKSQI